MRLDSDGRAVGRQGLVSTLAERGERQGVLYRLLPVALQLLLNENLVLSAISLVPVPFFAWFWYQGDGGLKE